MARARPVAVFPGDESILHRAAVALGKEAIKGSCWGLAQSAVLRDDLLQYEVPEVIGAHWSRVRHACRPSRHHFRRCPALGRWRRALELTGHSG